LSTRLKLNDRKELIDQQKTGKIKIKNPADVLALKDDIVDQQINNRRIDDAVKYSVVGLDFYQNGIIIKEVVANDDPSAYNIPFFQRLGLAFENGWSMFVDVMIGLTNLWVFVLAAIVIWRGIVFYKRKPSSKTAPAA
jgi:hypothetical protein